MQQEVFYETMYILRPDIPEEELESHVKKYSDLVVQSEAEVLDSQMRGKRRLAYPIAKHKEGVYVQLSHKGNGQQVAVLEKAMRLSEDVIRYLTVIQTGPLPTPKPPAASTEKDTKTDSKEKIESKDSKQKTEDKTKEEEKSTDKKEEDTKSKDN